MESSDAPTDVEYTGSYEDDVWDASREAECLARLAATGPELPAHARALHATKFGRYWDAFYRANATNFFKDRHYLEEEFPILQECVRCGGPHYTRKATRLPPDAPSRRRAATRPFALLELGCGVGNAFYPLVDRLPNLFVTACDVSRRACSLARAHPSYAGSGRVCVFPCDAIGLGLRAELESAQAEWDGAASEAVAEGAAPRALPCPWGSFDAVLVLFMASALAPEDHPRVFAAAASALRPGGTLLFRDYGAYDEAELRFRPGSRLGPHLFLRGDGTLAAFFTLPGIRELAAGAGLEVAAARYIFRRQRNRGQGTEMRRVFVQVCG